MKKIKQHYFFALWPDKRLQQHYAKFAHQYLDDLDGKFIPTHNIHITLSFLGELNSNQLKAAKHIAGTIKTDCFTLTLDRLGFWKGPRVVWISSNIVPKSLIELETTLQQKLQENEFEIDQRAYKPHMTLMRKTRSKPGNIQFKPVEWQVENFVLVRSTLEETGSIYDVIEQWSLI